MGQPFFRGAVQLDVYTGALLAACVNSDRLDLAEETWSSIEQSTWRKFPATFPGDIDSFLGIGEQYVVVLMEATETYLQWVLNVLGSLQTPVPLVPGKVAQFFGTVGFIRFQQMQSAVLAGLSGKSLLVIGHSLGGAAAQVFCTLMQGATGQPISCFTYGCPRVGNPEFASWPAPNQLIRISNVGDPIPDVPPPIWGGKILPLPFPGPLITAIYQHGGEGYDLDDLGDLSQSDSFPGFGVITALLNSQDPAQFHRITEYVSRARLGLDAVVLQQSGSGYVDAGTLDDVNQQLTAAGGVPNGLPKLQALPPEPEPINFRGGGGMTFRATFFYQAPNFGWTESFYNEAPDVPTMQGLCDALAKSRIGLCGTGVSIPYVRISDVNVFRDYGIFPLTWNSGQEDASQNSHVKPYDALLVDLINGPYRNRVFLRGVPQQDYLGDLPVNVNADFNSLFNNWKARLKKDQWEMRVQGRFAPDIVGGNVTNATQAAPIVITSPAHGLAAGQQVAIRGVKGNKGANGTWFIDVPDANTFSLRTSVGTGVYIGGGVWRKVAFFYKIIQDATVIREVKRSTGRPSFLPVGRRRRRTVA